MTVAATVPSASYLENGVTTVFAAPFYYRDAGELVVERLAADGTVTALVRPAQWNASAALGDAGGNVTLVTPGAAGGKLRIRRVTGRAQGDDYLTGGGFPAATAEAGFDRLAMVQQEQDFNIGDIQARALMVPANETIGQLPVAGSRTLKVLGFDAAGALTLSDLAALVQSVAGSLLATALNAQTQALAAQVAAEAARDATLAAYDNFDDRYLGAKAGNPALDNDGNALVAGTLYYNTTVPEMRLWTGAGWVAAYVSGSGFVSKTGDTMTGLLVLIASAVGSAGLNLGAGVAPAAPNNGDLWLTAVGLFARIAGSTRQLASLDATETLLNKSLTAPTSTGAIYDNGSVRGNLTAVAAADVDCSVGNFFTRTVNGAVTFTFSNAPNTRAFGFVLRMTYTAGVITWPAAVKWPSDVVPTFVGGKYYDLSFMTIDGGTTWHGATSGPYSA